MATVAVRRAKDAARKRSVRASIKADKLIQLESKAEKLRRVTRGDVALVSSGQYAEAVARWSARVLKIPVGLKCGKPFRLGKWQTDFLSLALSPGTIEAGLSVARKNGKSGLIASLLLAYLIGPLNVRDWRCIVVSLTGQLAAELRKQIAEIAVASGVSELLNVRSSPPPGKVIGLNNAEVSILAADRATGHAVGSDLVVIDEAGLLSEKDRELWNACLTSISGRGGRLVCISIRGDCPMFNELEKRKKSKGVVWVEYAADKAARFDDVKQWHRANPGLRLGIKSMDYMRHTAERALSSSADSPTFAAYDLNLSQSPTREMIISVAQYQQCVVSVSELSKRKGPVMVGIDLGGTSSMTAAVFYWVETGRLVSITSVLTMLVAA